VFGESLGVRWVCDGEDTILIVVRPCWIAIARRRKILMVASMFHLQGVAGRNTGRKRKTKVHLAPQPCGRRRRTRKHQSTLATKSIAF
jgi:hypothetical protein